MISSFGTDSETRAERNPICVTIRNKAVNLKEQNSV
jgi:hypothetical protein